MKIPSTILMFVLVLVPLLLFVLEFFLCKRHAKAALILPVVVACLVVFVGFYAWMVAAVLIAIYLVMRYIEKERQSKLSEMQKMNIEDL